MLLSFVSLLVCAGEGTDFVYRDMMLMPDHCNNPEAMVQMRDKVTWSEEEEEVRYALYEDEVKEGYIDNGQAHYFPHSMV